MGAPAFGASGVTSRSRNHSVDRVEHVDGLNKNLYIRSETGTISETDDICGSWGIEAEGTNQFSRSLRSVTLTESEEVVRHEIWSGATPAQTGLTDKLVGVDCIIKVRLEQRVSVQGLGALPTGYEVEDEGSLKNIDIDTAIGPTNIAVTNMFLESVNDERSTTEFGTWTLEFVKYTPQTDGTGQADLISGFSMPTDVDSTYYRITRTTTLTSEGFATTQLSIEEIYAYNETGGNWS